MFFWAEVLLFALLTCVWLRRAYFKWSTLPDEQPQHTAKTPFSLWVGLNAACARCLCELFGILFNAVEIAEVSADEISLALRALRTSRGAVTALLNYSTDFLERTEALQEPYRTAAVWFARYAKIYLISVYFEKDACEGEERQALVCSAAGDRGSRTTTLEFEQNVACGSGSPPGPQRHLCYSRPCNKSASANTYRKLHETDLLGIPSQAAERAESPEQAPLQKEKGKTEDTVNEAVEPHDDPKNNLLLL